MYRFLLIFTLLLLLSDSSKAQRFDWALDVESTSWSSDSYCFAITHDSNHDCSYVIGQQDNRFFVRK